MISFIFLTLKVLFLNPLWAINIYVAPVQGTGVDTQQLKTIRELIILQVKSSSQHDVVPVESEADYYLQAQLVKLETYSLSMTRWQGKEKIMQGQWNAATLTELESTLRVATDEVLTSSTNTQKAVLFDNQKTMA